MSMKEDTITIKPDDETRERLNAISTATGIRPSFLLLALLKQVAADAIERQRGRQIGKPTPPKKAA